MIHEDTRDVKKETKKLRTQKIKIKQNKMRICSSLFNVGIYCSICYQINRRFTQQKNSLRYEKVDTIDFYDLWHYVSCIHILCDLVDPFFVNENLVNPVNFWLLHSTP